MIDIEVAGAALGFFLTVSILSYLLLDDNMLFRLGAHLLVGISAGYLLAVMLRMVLIDQYLAVVLADPMQNLPLLILILLLTPLMLTRLAPHGSRLASLPMAFLVGVSAAVVVGGSLTGTFLPQIGAAIEPSLLPFNSEGPDFASMFENWFVLLGTLTTLAYFHFSARPRVGGPPVRTAGIREIAAVGKGVLTVTLGALYAGALLSALAVLVEHLYSLLQPLLPILSGGSL